MRRTFREQPVIVGFRPLAPAPVGVVTGLLGQDPRLVIDDIDDAFVVPAPRTG